MTKQEMLVEFLIDNPQATNSEIAEALNISIGYAKKIISDLKRLTVLNISSIDGLRSIDVFPDRLTTHARTKIASTKRERLEQLVDIVFEAIEQEAQIENIINAGHLIIKLVDRL